MKSKITVFIVLISLLVTSCVKEGTTDGYVTETSRFDEIEVGKTTKKEVRKMLGSPSSVSNFGNEKWLYIGRKTENIAFFEPELVSQDVFYITFDDNGLVEEAGKKTAEDAKNITFSEDKTQTEGNSVGVIEQLLGNLGRFNPKQ